MKFDANFIVKYTVYITIFVKVVEITNNKATLV